MTTQIPTLPSVDLMRYIDTKWFGDRPHIRGRRIPIWVIVHTAIDNNFGVPELMYNFDLSETEVLAALLYYMQHKDEIETLEEADREQYRYYHEED
jgi:uncharacterized protein (DUF433 family)